MHVVANKLYCFLMAVIFTNGALAQANFILKHYNTENGLPQNSVLDIQMDSKGFVWLATENGLVRYDGQAFRYFNLNNTPALKKTDRMRVIVAADDGTLYFRNSLYDVFKITSPGTITAVEPLQGKNPLVAEKASLIYQQDFEKQFEEVRKNNPQVTDSFWQQDSYRINSQEMYAWGVAGKSNICYLQKSGSSTRLCGYEPGRHYVANDTLIVWDGNAYFTAYYKNSPPTSLALAGDITHDSLYHTGLGSLEVLGRGTAPVIQLGNNYYTMSRRGNVLFTRLLFANLQLSNVLCVCTDSGQNQYFFGTRSDGLYVVKRQDFKNIAKPGSKNPEGSSFNAFGKQVLLDDTSILTDVFVTFDKNGRPAASPSHGFSGGYNDWEGCIWYELRGWIYKADGQLRTTMRLPVLDSSGIRFITQDSISKKLWCSSPGRVFYINQAAQRLEPLPPVLEASEEVTCLTPADSNTLWVGSNNGLYLVQLKTFTKRKIAGTDRINVRYLLPDKNNHLIWVATYGSGPCYIKNDSLRHLPVDRQKGLLTPHCFVPDANGFFWMPTNHGIFQVRVNDWLAYIRDTTQNVYYQYYSNKDGFASNEFNGGFSNAYIRRPDGLVSLASMKGLVWFTPEKVRAVLPGNPVYFDRLTVNGKELTNPAALQLPYNYSQLGIYIATPYYGNEENLHLQYQLKGYDENWTDIPGNNAITLARLPHGRYELVVRNLAGFGGNYVQAAWPFEVLPAWYQTVWFYILSGVVSAGIILLAVRLRLNRLLQRKKELEAEVASRTASLHETLENYKQINTQLEVAQEQLLEGDKTKEDMIAIILHDLWSPLKFIAETSTSIAGNKEKYSLEECFAYLSNLSTSSTNILQLTDQLLKWMRSQHGAFKLNIKQTNVAQLFSNIAKLYKEIALQRNNHIQIDCDESATVFTDETVITLIIRNMVDNANKNTKNGTILLAHHTGSSGDHTLSIKDSGRGMDEETLEQVRQLAFQETLKSSSLGFRFAFEFARLLNAVIKIDSVVGEGTTVAIHLPGQLPNFTNGTAPD